VAACEAALVALAVRRDVLRVPLAELVDRLLDHLVAPGLPHRLGAVVGVSTSAVPVTLHKAANRFLLLACSFMPRLGMRDYTLIGFGSRDSTTPAISVIL
jgi:hypothetical protein